MNQCDKCKVNIHAQHEACPLCGKRLGAPAHDVTMYPDYAVTSGDIVFPLRKIVIFFVIVASAITVFINVFTYQNTPELWSIIVVLSLVFSWRMFSIVMTRKANAGRKILSSYLTVSILLIAIDIYSGFFKWSTTYVIPFMTILIAFLFTILAVRSKRSFNEYMGILLAIFFISLCPVITFLLSLSTRGWTSLVAILYCLLTVVGLVMFMGRDFREEIKKRFYY